MSTPTDPQVQMLSMFLQAFKLLGDAFLQLTARVDAVKEIVCELHPEVAARLNEKIRQDQSETSKQFSELQRMIELLSSSVSGQTH
jgi:hypothetical protein